MTHLPSARPIRGRLTRLRSLAGALLLAASAGSQATVFDYAYLDTSNTTSGPEIVSGTFVGTLGADGNTITGITAPTAMITGGKFNGYVFSGLHADSYNYGTRNVDSGGAIVTIDGSKSNFFFDSSLTSGNETWFYVIPFGNGLGNSDATQTAVAGVFNTFNNGTYDPSHWRVVAEAVAVNPPPAGVPEPASLALLGAGLVAFVGNRRRRRA